MSIKTGVAPVLAIASAVAQYVKEGQNTASPGPISHAYSGSTIASVPFAQPRAYFDFPNFAKFFSNFLTSGPSMY